MGAFCGDLETYTTEILQNTAHSKISNHVAKATDGRAFSIVRTPMPGGGWITEPSKQSLSPTTIVVYWVNGPTTGAQQQPISCEYPGSLKINLAKLILRSNAPLLAIYPMASYVR